MLTEPQIKAANNLRASRPETIQNSNVIASDSARAIFYDQVVSRMQDLEVSAQDCDEFCNVCGVPD